MQQCRKTHSREEHFRSKIRWERWTPKKIRTAHTPKLCYLVGHNSFIPSSAFFSGYASILSLINFSSPLTRNGRLLHYLSLLCNLKTGIFYVLGSISWFNNKSTPVPPIIPQLDPTKCFSNWEMSSPKLGLRRYHFKMLETSDRSLRRNTRQNLVTVPSQTISQENLVGNKFQRQRI